MCDITDFKVFLHAWAVLRVKCNRNALVSFVHFEECNPWLSITSYLAPGKICQTL